MKRCSLIAVLVLVAFTAIAATNEVKSVNAVGFIRETVPEGEWTLLSLPFVKLDGSVTATIDEILPDAPLDTEAWYYDNNNWDSDVKQLFGWNPASHQYIRGDAMFVKVPGGSGPVDLTVMGEVPGAQTAPTSTVVVATGWTLLGFSYPSDVALTNTTLAASAALDDSIWWYDAGTGWQSATRQLFGWSDPTLVLEAGKGYFFNAAAGFDWTETKPYVWP